MTWKAVLGEKTVHIAHEETKIEGLRRDEVIYIYILDP